MKAGPTYLAALLDPQYKRLPHLDLINDAIVKIEANRDHWLLANTPPQVGKTVTAVEWSTFWWLIKNPHHRVIVVSYNDDYAVDRGRAIQGLVTKYGELFGLRLQRGASSVKDWKLANGGGSVYSAGIRGGITGRTGNMIIIDDYLKSRAEADSARERSRLMSAISSEVLTRRSPGAPVIVPCTLWHHLEPILLLVDRLGTIEEGGMWRHLKLPAIATANDPLGRQPGQPLTRVDGDGNVLTTQQATAWWKEQQLSNHSIRDWMALYLTNPQPGEGALMTNAQITAARGTPPTEFVREVLAVDPADADSLDASGNDANGIVHAGRDKHGVIWVLANYSMPGPVDTWSKRLVELAHLLEVDEIVYERNKGGKAIEFAIKAQWANSARAGTVAGMCPHIYAVTATKNKITRASPVVAMLNNGEARLSETSDLSAIETQLLTYQAGSSDSPDDMDAMVWAVTRIYTPNTPKQYPRSRPQSEMYG